MAHFIVWKRYGDGPWALIPLDRERTNTAPVITAEDSQGAVEHIEHGPPQENWEYLVLGWDHPSREIISALSAARGGG